MDTINAQFIQSKSASRFLLSNMVDIIHIEMASGHLKCG